MWLPLAWPQLGTWPTTQACALTRNPNGDLSGRRPVLSPLSHTSQGYRKFTEGLEQVWERLEVSTPRGLSKFFALGGRIQ